MRLTTLLAASLPILIPVNVSADTWLEYRAISSEASPNLSGSALVVRDGDVGLFDAEESRGPVVLFRSESKELLFIEHSYREYTVMTESWLKDANDKAEKSVVEMQAQMEKKKSELSPRMRQQFDQANTMMKFMPLMGGMMIGGDDGLEYSMTTRSMKFSDINCRQLDEFYQEEKSRVFCVGKAGDLGIGQTDAAAIEDFLESLGRMSEAGVFEYGFMKPVIVPTSKEYHGVPVAVSHPDGSGYLLAPTGDAVNVPSLDIPENYLRAEIPMLGF